MSPAFPFLVELVNSLAIVAGLAWGYGLVSRRLAGRPWTPVALGALFGGVAVLQMGAPLEPVDGTVIDLSCVPLTLAAAFLGWRGALGSVAISVPALVGFGGAGLSAGVAAAALSAAGGLVWQRTTRHMPRRGIEQWLRLALATSSSLLAGLLLPPDLAAPFYRDMALPLGAAYLLVVPLVGALLERERLGLGRTGDDSDAGPQGQKRFARDVAEATAAGTAGPLVGAVVVKIRDRRFLTRHWGASAMGQVLGGLRHRFLPLIPAGGILGVKDDGCLLIAVTAGQWVDLEAFRAGLHRAAAEGAMTLPDGHRTRVAISTRIARFSNPASVQAVIDDLDAPAAPAARPGRIRHEKTARKPVATASVRGTLRVPDANRTLFARAEAMLQARGS